MPNVACICFGFHNFISSCNAVGITDVFKDNSKVCFHCQCGVHFESAFFLFFVVAETVLLLFLLFLLFLFVCLFVFNEEFIIFKKR